MACTVTLLVIASLTGTAAALGALFSREARRPAAIPIPLRTTPRRRAH
ncbi:MAG: hypothetical protein WKF93_08665 [Acidimicrobiales bacterium]